MASLHGSINSRSSGRTLINPFLTFLERISKEIVQDELESLKFLLDDYIPEGTLEKCITARKLFRCMKNHGLLGENNLDHLEQLLTRADRLDLAEEVKIFKEQRGMEVDSELLAVEMVCFSFAVRREHFNKQETMDALLNNMSGALGVDPGQCRLVRCEEDAVNWFNLILELPKRKELLDGLRNSAITKAPWLAHCGVKVVRIGKEAEIHMQSPITPSPLTSIRADVPCIQDVSPNPPCLYDDKKLDMIVVVDCATTSPVIMTPLKAQLKHVVDGILRRGLHLRLALISYQNHPPLARMREGHWHMNSTAYVENFTDDKEKMKRHIQELRCFGNRGSRRGLADGLALAVRLSKNDDGDDSKCRKEALKVCILLPLEAQSRNLDIFKCTHGHDVMGLCRQLAENSVALYTVLRKTLKSAPAATYLPNSAHIDMMAEFFTGISLMTGGQFIYSQTVKLVSEIIFYFVQEDISMECLYGTAHDIIIEELKKTDDGEVDLEELKIKLEEALNRRFCRVKLITIHGSTIGPSSKSAKKFSLDDCIDSAGRTFQRELPRMQQMQQSIANAPETPSDVNMEEATSPQVSLSTGCKITSEVSERMVRRVVQRREQNRPTS